MNKLFILRAVWNSNFGKLAYIRQYNMNFIKNNRHRHYILCLMSESVTSEVRKMSESILMKMHFWL